MIGASFFIVLLVGYSSLALGDERLFATSNGLVMYARMDPIVTPGTCSGHVHSVFGNLNFANTVTTAALGSTAPTSSNVVPNKSMYWVPSMYIKKGDTFYLVKSWARNYYFGYAGISNPPPFGIRMLVGNSSHTFPWNPKTETVKDALRWTRRTQNRATTNPIEHGDWTYITKDGIYPEELELVVDLPDCVQLKDGKPVLDSPNHRSHLAYGRQATCPSTHPYKIARISIEARFTLSDLWGTLGKEHVENTANWYLSNGDRSGGSAHGDFISGWPESLFRGIIAGCEDGKNANGKTCPISQYFTSSQATLDSTAERYVANPSLLKSVPNEIVSRVKQLPAGACPGFTPFKNFATEDFDTPEMTDFVGEIVADNVDAMMSDNVDEQGFFVDSAGADNVVDAIEQGFFVDSAGADYVDAMMSDNVDEQDFFVNYDNAFADAMMADSVDEHYDNAADAMGANLPDQQVASNTNTPVWAIALIVLGTVTLLALLVVLVQLAKISSY